ncbi:hypothetical protein RCL1_009165 [Eukaryota sp. TZLM3-RCL]
MLILVLLLLYLKDAGLYKELLFENIQINSTADLAHHTEANAAVKVTGSKTEGALMIFAEQLGAGNYLDTRNSADIIKLWPFSSSNKRMDVVVRRNDDSLVLYTKGAAEIIVELCSAFVLDNEVVPMTPTKTT